MWSQLGSGSRQMHIVMDQPVGEGELLRIVLPLPGPTNAGKREDRRVAGVPVG